VLKIYHQSGVAEAWWTHNPQISIKT